MWPAQYKMVEILQFNSGPLNSNDADGAII